MREQGVDDQGRSGKGEKGKTNKQQWLGQVSGCSVLDLIAEARNEGIAAQSASVRSAVENEGKSVTLVSGKAEDETCRIKTSLAKIHTGGAKKQFVRRLFLCVRREIERRQRERRGEQKSCVCV